MQYSAHNGVPLKALNMPVQFFDKVLLPQYHLGPHIFPDRKIADPSSDKSPVVAGGLMTLFAKLTEHPVHNQPRRRIDKPRRPPT